MAFVAKSFAESKFLDIVEELFFEWSVRMVIGCV